MALILACLCPGADAVENPYQGLNIPDIPEQIDPREVLELRSDNSFTLDNGDGTYTGFFYGEPIFNVPKEERPNLIAWLFSVIVPDATATTTNFYGMSSSGYITGAASTYKDVSTAARSQADTCWTTTATYYYIGQRYTGSVYQCYRAYLDFDTDALDGYTVSQANVYMKAYTDNSDTDFDIRLMHDNWTEALCSNTESNYDDCLSASTYTLWKSTSTWSSGTYYASSNITTSWIDTDGDTKFSIISSRDDAGTEPTGNEYVQVYGVPAPLTSSDPYLAVVYSDVSPPTPNPPAGLTVNAASTSSINISCNVCSDISTPISYYFDETSGNSGGTDSGWQSADVTYTDTGLSTNVQYTYRVKAKDAVPNEGSYSSTISKYTYAAVPGTPALSNVTATTIDVNPDSSTNPAATTFQIRVVYGETTKYVQADGTLGDDSYYATDATWGTTTVTGLTAATEYTFDVSARNRDLTATAYGATAAETTLAGGIDHRDYRTLSQKGNQWYSDPDADNSRVKW